VTDGGDYKSDLVVRVNDGYEGGLDEYALKAMREARHDSKEEVHRSSASA
jgi:hypothetical protein